jgi:flagellar hook-associated protein 1 FlgK
MSSGLFGFYTAQRSLLLNQAAINVINNNVANINTEGYSKQRLEISQFTNEMFDANNPLVLAQSGLGAVIDSISRNRDAYIDSSYRSATSNQSYYAELYDNVGLIEDITNGLSDTGLSAAFSEFYTAAQQLNQNPTDSVFRTNFVQRAIDVATKFNQVSSQLTTIKTNLVGDVSNTTTFSTSKISLDCDDLNNKLSALADLNKTISLSTAQGTTPNSLMDSRDNLLDEISAYIPITVTASTDNMVNVSLGGTELVSGQVNVGVLKYELQDTSIAGDWTTNPPVVKVQDMNGRTIVKDASSKITSGKIGAILDITGSDPEKPTIDNMLDSFNLLAQEFATQVNNIQLFNDATTTPGTTVQAMCIDSASATPALKVATHKIFLNQDDETTSSDSLITAANIQINSFISSDPTEIAAARLSYTTATGPAAIDLKGTGDGSNALKMAQLANINLPNINNSTTEKFLSSISSNFGVQVKSVEDRLESNEAILEQVSLKRESASGVNLDEEYTDLIKFQRSYEASAKVFNVINEIMQTIIALGS